MKKSFQTVKDFILYFIKKTSDGEPRLASSHLAYYLLLSFIPLLMVSFQLVVLVIPNLAEIIIGLTVNLPNDVQNLINPIIRTLTSAGSSTISIIAIASALWAGSRGFLGLKSALNSIFDVSTESKIPFFDVIFSVLYTIAFLVLLTLLLLFSVYNEKIMSVFKSVTDNFEVLNIVSGWLIDGIGFLMPFAIAIAIFVFFYRYSPSFNRENRITWFQAFLGAVVSTLLIAAITYFYKFSNDVLTRSPSIYGSLGSILVTLVWLLGLCQMIIYGALFIKTYVDVIVGNRTVKNLEAEEHAEKMRRFEIEEKIRKEAEESNKSSPGDDKKKDKNKNQDKDKHINSHEKNEIVDLR